MRRGIAGSGAGCWTSFADRRVTTGSTRWRCCVRSARRAAWADLQRGGGGGVGADLGSGGVSVVGASEGAPADVVAVGAPPRSGGDEGGRGATVADESPADGSASGRAAGDGAGAVLRGP